MDALKEYQQEYVRLANWRELWLRLSNKPEHGRLQTRQEAIERRAWIANNRIGQLMQSFDRQKDEAMPKRVDQNQKEIVLALRGAGVDWISTTADPNLGFDGLAIFRRTIYICEIKNGSLPPSARKLTENELKRQRQCEAAGVPYLILLNPEQALEAICEEGR